MYVSTSNRGMGDTGTFGGSDPAGGPPGNVYYGTDPAGNPLGATSDQIALLANVGTNPTATNPLTVPPGSITQVISPFSTGYVPPAVASSPTKINMTYVAIGAGVLLLVMMMGGRRR